MPDTPKHTCNAADCGQVTDIGDSGYYLNGKRVCCSKALIFVGPCDCTTLR